MHKPLKMRHLPLVIRATLPTSAPAGAPRPALLAVTGSAALAGIGADGTLARLSMGSDNPALASATDPWMRLLALADTGGPGTVAVLSGVLLDGLGTPVVGGVIDVVASCVIAAPPNVTSVVPAAVTGTLGAVVEGFAVGPVAAGCSFSYASGAAGVFNLTLTVGAAGQLWVGIKYRHMGWQLDVAVP